MSTWSFILIDICVTLITGLVLLFLHLTWRQTLLGLLITLLLPGCGLLITLFLFIPSKIDQLKSIKTSKTIHTDVFSPAFSTSFSPALSIDSQTSYSRSHLLQLLNYEEEIKTAPINAMLHLAPYHQRRQMMLNLLQSSPQTYASYVNQALQNDDSETAHMAASRLMSLRRSFDLKLARLSASYADNKNSLSIAYEYCQTIDQFLQTVDVDHASFLHYHQEIVAVLEDIIQMLDKNKRIEYRQPERQPANLEEEDRCFDLIRHLIQIGQIDKARAYIKQLNFDHIHSEKNLVTLLHCYYLDRQYAAFTRLITYIHDTNMQLSSETSNLIHFWLSADQDAFNLAAAEANDRSKNHQRLDRSS